ncbi:MAG: hypothetical protein ACLRP3_00550 [Escherichia sp.]
MICACNNGLYKSLLDKLKVSPMCSAWQWQPAVEPFIRDDMSPAAPRRQPLDWWLWQNYLNLVPLTARSCSAGILAQGCRFNQTGGDAAKYALENAGRCTGIECEIEKLYQEFGWVTVKLSRYRYAVTMKTPADTGDVSVSPR